MEDTHFDDRDQTYFFFEMNDDFNIPNMGASEAEQGHKHLFQPNINVMHDIEDDYLSEVWRMIMTIIKIITTPMINLIIVILFSYTISVQIISNKYFFCPKYK